MKGQGEMGKAIRQVHNSYPGTTGAPEPLLPSDIYEHRYSYLLAEEHEAQLDIISTLRYHLITGLNLIGGL